jgi:hypothetical protein
LSLPVVVVMVLREPQGADFDAGLLGEFYQANA